MAGKSTLHRTTRIYLSPLNSSIKLKEVHMKPDRQQSINKKQNKLLFRPHDEPQLIEIIIIINLIVRIFLSELYIFSCHLREIAYFITLFRYPQHLFLFIVESLVLRLDLFALHFINPLFTRTHFS